MRNITSTVPPKRGTGCFSIWITHKWLVRTQAKKVAGALGPPVSYWVIMPNHIHILIETRPEWPLYRVIGSFKRYTARVANQLLSRTGAFWARDYFDRYIREAEHYNETVCYIENNPVKAGLCIEPRAWRCSSAWIDPPLSRTIEL